MARRASLRPAAKPHGPSPATASPVAAPEVIIGEGRPEVSTLVRVASFDGPLAMLLALIEARELDVLTVPLGALADAYLDALAGLEGDRLANVSAFVAVASQLILIKSRAMLPRAPQPAVPLPDEGPDPEAELRARLILYRTYRDAGRALAALADLGRRLITREPAAAARAAAMGAVPAPGPPLDPEILRRAIRAAVRIAPHLEEPPGIVPRTITLTERAAIIRAALGEAGVVVLQELLRGVRDRVVVAVTFLALLELVKRREVTVEQTEPWGPIVARAVARNGSEGQTNGHADGAPLDERLEGYA